MRNQAQVAAEIRERWLLAREPMVFETVMSHPSKLAFLQRAQVAGYRIELVFVSTVNPLLNVCRVAERVRAGGHDVPQARVFARYYRVMHLLPKAVELSDRFKIFDNSEKEMRLVMEGGSEEGGLDWRLVSSMPMPQWVYSHLGQPLTARRSDRKWLMDAHPVRIAERAYSMANELSGRYQGRIVAVSTHYFLQEGQGGEHVCHDLALFPPDVTFVPGKDLTVRYNQCVVGWEQGDRRGGWAISGTAGW